MSVVFIEATVSDAKELANSLRNEDRHELELWSSRSAEDELIASINGSDFALSAYSEDGTLLSLFGVDCRAGMCGNAWMLSGKGVERWKKSFLQGSRVALDECLKRSSRARILIAYTDIGYKRALRWMEWLGFFETGLRIAGKNGGCFVQMAIVNPYYWS